MAYSAIVLLSMKGYYWYSGLLTDHFSFKETSHCAVFDCDSATTECQESEYPECKCKNGLSKTEWDDRSCSGKNLATLFIPERLTWSSCLSLFEFSNALSSKSQETHVILTNQ